jgi:hypothetical protein
LVLQATGGAITDAAKIQHTRQNGIDIAIAGLLSQSISLGVFVLIMADFGMTCRKRPSCTSPEYQATRSGPFFKIFLASLLLATVLILTRSIYRVAELWGGFSGTLWNDQVDFMVLDGAMVAASVICLTAFHPGLSFGGKWDAANWTLRRKKTSLDASAGGEDKELATFASH